MTRQTEKAPAYQWYPRDFAADEPVVLMTLEEEGAYRRLLDHQWLHGSIPADIRLLAAICKGVSVARMRRIWRALEVCFVPVEDDQSRLVNSRMERDRQAAIAYKESQRVAGAAGGKAKARRRRESSERLGSPDSRHDSASSDGLANSSSASATASASAIEEQTNAAARVRAREGWTEARLREQLPESCWDDLRTVLVGSAAGRDAAVRAIAAMAGLDPHGIPAGPGMRTCTPEEMAGVLSRIASSERPRWHQSLANRCLDSLRKDAAAGVANDPRSMAERARDWAMEAQL